MVTARSRRAQTVARRSFPGVPDSVAHVRDWIEQTCAYWQVPIPEVLTLVASELVSNAIARTHSGLPGGQFATRLLLYPDRMRLEVRDAGPLFGRTPLRRTPALTAEHGRGLVLVDALATDWEGCPQELEPSLDPRECREGVDEAPATHPLPPSGRPYSD